MGFLTCLADFCFMGIRIRNRCSVVGCGNGGLESSRRIYEFF